MTLQAGHVSPHSERTFALIAGNRSQAYRTGSHGMDHVDVSRTREEEAVSIPHSVPGPPASLYVPLVLWSTRIHCPSVSDSATPEPWYTRAGLLLRYHIRWASPRMWFLSPMGRGCGEAVFSRPPRMRIGDSSSKSPERQTPDLDLVTIGVRIHSTECKIIASICKASP